MDRGCFFCREKCSLNSVYSHIDSIYSVCTKSNILKQICNVCSYNKTCKKNCKGDCATHRQRETQDMAKKSDRLILDYLSFMPSVNCPNEQIDLKILAFRLADENHYGNIHTSDDWEKFAKFSGITKSEEDYIREDRVPKFIDEAKEIIAKKEAKHASLNFSNMSEKTNDCVNCPEEIKNKCISAVLPDDWMVFPDLYMAEAIKRGLSSKIR